MVQSEILVSFRLLVDYTRRLVDDIPPNDFAAQPGGNRNHPAWILGHLCYSFQAMGGELGLSPWLPNDWPPIFGTGSTPSADIENYPPKSSLIATFNQSVRRIENAVEGLTDQQLDAPLPDAEARQTLPTIAHALTHILIGHASVHIGQLTCWRAAMQLPHVPEQFDKSKR